MFIARAMCGLTHVTKAVLCSSCSLLCISNSDWATENEAGRSLSVNGNEEPRWRDLSPIQFSCNCNYSLITHNKTPIYSTCGLLSVCAACPTPRLNVSSELRPPWKQQPRYVPYRVRNGYNKVQVSATGWSLVQRSPSDRGASLSVIYKLHEWGGPGPHWGRSVLIDYMYLYIHIFGSICYKYIFRNWHSWGRLTKAETCNSKVKAKCTLVQALRLCTGRTAHRGNSGIAVLYRHWGSVQAVRPIGGVEV